MPDPDPASSKNMTWTPAFAGVTDCVTQKGVALLRATDKNRLASGMT